MSTKIYNLEETIAMARKAVEERGEDWVYPKEGEEWRYPGFLRGWTGQCRYALADGSKTPRPACIVGHIYHQIGALDKIADSMASAFDLDVTPFTEAAIEFLTDVQQRQDDGEPWGLSVSLAVVKAMEAR